MMYKRFLFCLLLFFMGVDTFSQKQEPKPLLVRFNFIGLTDVLDNNFTAGVEYRFKQNWSTGADVGYVFASGYIPENQGVSGILFRPFIRFYPKANSGIFIESELHYKRVAYTLEDWIGKMPVDGVPAYEEYTRFNYIKRAIGMHFKFGKQFSLTKDDKLRMEFNAGLGFRFKKEFSKEGDYTPDSIFIFIDNRTNNAALVVMPVNLRLCYQIR